MTASTLQPGLVLCTALTVLTGCATEMPQQSATHRPRPAVHVQASLVIMDDYDYYPGYEVYYSRSRREYVYLEDRAWVRRPAPRGVTVATLSSSPSVRVDFRDAPEQHHSRVVRDYPRNWTPPGRNNDAPVRSPQQVVHTPVIVRAAPPVHAPAPVRAPAAVQATIVIVDDYDYYPGYEIYYSRNRREYVYLEGRTWVRRPAPQGVAVNVLIASPAVRMTFQDAPERHHGEVVRNYPKHWSPPGKGRDDKKHDDKDREDKDKDREDKNDRREGKKNDR